jgi:hypothetical protein
MTASRIQQTRIDEQHVADGQVPRSAKAQVSKLWFSIPWPVGALVHVGRGHQRDLTAGLGLAQVVVEATAAEDGQCGAVCPGSQIVPLGHPVEQPRRPGQPVRQFRTPVRRNPVRLGYLPQFNERRPARCATTPAQKISGASPAEQNSGASHSPRPAPEGNGATAGAAEMFEPAPQARTAVPLQLSRHDGLQRTQRSPLLSGTLPDARAETSEPQFALAKFGTTVSACGSLRRRPPRWRTISWRVQVREKASDRGPTGESSTSATYRAAENSPGVEVGDQHRDLEAVAPWVRARCPRRISIAPHSYRAPWRTRLAQAARGGAHYREHDRTSRHHRCSRPHPVIRRPRPAACRDELIRKDVRYGHV